jgi:hypothetical protein
MTDITAFAAVVGVSPDLIHVEVKASDKYRNLERHLEIGSYLKISDDDGATVIAVVQSYRIKDRPPGSSDEAPGAPTFILETQPVGHLQDGDFHRGGKQITIPPTHVEIATPKVLSQIYDSIATKGAVHLRDAGPG